MTLALALALGTMFWAARPTVTVTELYSFAGRLDGARPTDLIVGSDGAISGWTDRQGPSGGGTIFRLTPEGKLEVLMALTDGPRMRLTEVAPGQFYGCGLSDGEVVLYKLGVTGDVSVLHSFGEFRGAGWLQDRLVRASDGEFFGVTRDSLRQPSRLIEVTPREQVVVVHEFDRFSGGALALMHHSNGNLYGTTRQGGDWKQGTLFRFTPQDGLQIVYSFSGRNGDVPPKRWLVEGARGEIYGDAGGLLVRLRIGEHSTSMESFRLGWSIIGLTRGFGWWDSACCRSTCRWGRPCRSARTKVSSWARPPCGCTGIRCIERCGTTNRRSIRSWCTSSILLGLALLIKLVPGILLPLVLLIFT